MYAYKKKAMKLEIKLYLSYRKHLNNTEPTNAAETGHMVHVLGPHTAKVCATSTEIY